MGTEIISGTESPARLEERKDMSYLRDGKSPEGVKAQEKRGIQTLTARGDVNRRANAVLVQTFGPDPLKKRPIMESYFVNVSILIL